VQLPGTSGSYRKAVIKLMYSLSLVGLFPFRDVNFRGEHNRRTDETNGRMFIYFEPAVSREARALVRIYLRNTYWEDIHEATNEIKGRRIVTNWADSRSPSANRAPPTLPTASGKPGSWIRPSYRVRPQHP
jgi:hypothetical protein